jgi:hypothetical protein
LAHQHFRGLDAGGDTGFAARVRRMISQVLVLVIVALSLAQGAHAHVLHASERGRVAHVHSHAHDQYAARAYTQTGPDLVYQATHPDGGPSAPFSGQCDCCLAASCCAHAAVPLPALTGLMPVTHTAPALVARDAHVPYGQLSHPPLRPPRVPV